jgi:signal transduction histidine kinase
MASATRPAPARHAPAAPDVRPPDPLRPLSDLEAFVAGAAHDLRDPLQTALGHLDLLEMRLDPSDPEVQQSLADARDALLRMRTSLEDMLAYARSTQPAEVQALDLDAIVRTVLKDLKAPLEAAGATVEAGRLPKARGHAPHVARIVQNLLSNAAKYRGGRPPAIRVSGAVSGGRVRLDVADNGRGMAPEELARLFRPFVRLPSSRGVAGTGLGLATSARLAQAMGGRLWADSEPGKGSTFHLELAAS